MQYEHTISLLLLNRSFLRIMKNILLQITKQREKKVIFDKCGVLLPSFKTHEKLKL